MVGMDKTQQRIVIVGGGVAGLEIASTLGRRWRRRKDGPTITLVDSDSAHVWKPMLHTIAAGTRDISQQQTTYIAQARDAGFAYKPGELRGLDRSAREILLGEDDRHLDFRVSVLCSPAPSGVSPGGRQLVLSTVIRYHNVCGRLYFLVVGPFHRALVKSALRRAARIGWPDAGEGRAA